MTIELYVFPPSPRSFKVMALANHLGLAHEIKFVDLRNGGQKAPHLEALNPNKKIPVLKHGDFVLWESNAILQYLASLKPEAQLFPIDECARADVTRWQFWDLAHWEPACVVFIYEYMAKPTVLGINQPDLAAIENGMGPFHRVASILNNQLRGKEFVTGNRLTVADFSLGAEMTAAKGAHFPLEPYEEIKRWYATLSSFPCWQETLAGIRLPAAA
jgi:glutathione S-transferase